MGGYVEPVASWGNFTQVLPTEGAGGNAKSLFYLCGVMPDQSNDIPVPPPGASKFPTERLKVVESNALGMLQKNVEPIWPKVTAANGELDWSALEAPDSANGQDRLKTQFFHVNVDPSERYVISAAGSDQYRLSTDGSGFSNLYLTGSWIDHGFNVSCVEATVMSGMAASRAISGVPQVIVGGLPPSNKAVST